MSLTEENKETTSKAKVRLTAAWEWFKSAAWLQVLLIVAIVVGVVVAIPYIVQGISDLVSSTNSHFYESREITYDDFVNMIDGNDPNRADGYVGDGVYTSSTAPSTYADLVSEEREGFVLMFVKANCDNCDSIQWYLENWYNNFNRADGINQNLRLYTIDVSYVPDDADESETAEGYTYLYENESITLEEQTEMLGYLRSTYLKQDSDHQSDDVDDSTFNSNYASNGAGTLPTPTFVLYTKSKDETAYDIANPTKVIFGAIGDLDYTTQGGMNNQMLDVFNFAVYKTTV